MSQVGVIKVGGFGTSKLRLILQEIPLGLLYQKKGGGGQTAYLCWQDFMLLVSETITHSNVMTQMVLCPKMKYKYVRAGSLPQFYSTTKCYLEIKAWECGIKMRNQSTSLTNIIASSGKSNCYCFDPKPHHNHPSSIWAAGWVTCQHCWPKSSTKSNGKMRWSFFF